MIINKIFNNNYLYTQNKYCCEHYLIIIYSLLFFCCRNSSSPVFRETMKSPVMSYVLSTDGMYHHTNTNTNCCIMAADVKAFLLFLEQRCSWSRPSTSSDQSSQHCDTPLAISNR